MKRFYLTFILIFIFWPVSSYALQNEDCFSCHGKTGSRGFVDKALYHESAHGEVRCSGCHIDIAGYPHRKEVIRVKCGICHFLGREGALKERPREYQLSVHGKAVRMGNIGAPDCQTCHGSHYIFGSWDPRANTYRQKVPALCSGCHSREYEAYRNSVHGKGLIEKGDLKAATCFDCHMEHLTAGVNEEKWKFALIKECGHCHTDEMKTYSKTYHGKVTTLGYVTAARCSDCHGSHNIRGAGDRGSTLSGENILNTCRKCHPKATKGFTKFYAHAEEHNRSKYPLLYYTYLSMVSLLVSVFSFFFIHTFLWLYRSVKERAGKKRGGPV